MVKSKDQKTKGTPPKKRAMKAARSGRKAVKKKVRQSCPLQEHAETYADLVNSSQPWTWSDIDPSLTRTQKRKIRHHAQESGMVPVIPVDANMFPDFDGFVAEDNTNLPEELHESTDDVQFRWLNRDLQSRNDQYDPETQSFPPDTKRYTWHHHQDTGRMQLVEFGVHNATNHKGGRTTWALGDR